MSDGSILSTGTDVVADSIDFENGNLKIVPGDSVPSKPGGISDL